MAKEALGQRAARVLNSDSITSAEINLLIDETAAAITEGEAVAAEEKQRAFDPALSPDPKSARERMEDALFKVGRLKTLLPRLEQRANEVRAQEERKFYEAKRDELQAEADAIEDELIETYCDCAERMMDMFDRASDFRDRVRGELPFPPAGVDTFRKFDRSVHRLLNDVALVDLDGNQVWPPRSLRHGNPNSLAVLCAQSAVVPHPGPRWCDPDFQAQRRLEIEKEQATIARYHEQAAKAEEDRQNREERDRFNAAQLR